ncbi:Dabb family protein [Streptomyces sp. NPDC093085]|uniref:Dabb family protein n=1 Tax=Streptomyces sp. NPDC093085 TaxID=3155068 RepID=UPI00341B9B7E
MIYHGNRCKLREDVTAEQLQEALTCLEEQGKGIPAVKSFIFGPEHNSEFDWSAIFVLEDLDGYEEYLKHPLHTRSELVAFPLMEKFESFDISDAPDPELGARIAELQRQNFESKPELVALVANLAAHSGSSAPQ